MAQRSRIGGIAALGGIILLAAITVGITLEQAARRRDAQRFPQVGRSVDIGGRSLNLYCSGEGSPTVILTAGPPMPGYSWVWVQREIAGYTRACWYDRAGYGWSDPAPYPRDSKASAADLHALLQKGGVGPPYVLVGASFAGLDVRIYQSLYPKEVAGIALADAVQEDELTRMPEIRGKASPLMPFIGTARSMAARAANLVGVTRMLRRGRRDDGRPKELTDAEWDTVQGLLAEPRTMTALMQESIEVSCDEVRATGKPGALPLIVLASPGAPVRMELQAQMSALSPIGKEVIVENGNGNVALYAPEKVVAAVKELVAAAR